MLSAHQEASKALPRSAMLIAGNWVTSSSDGASIEHIDPSTGRPLGTFPRASKEDVDAAVQGARAAFPAWRTTPVDERRRVMYNIAQVLRAHEPELVTIMALEIGSPVNRGVVGRIADQFEYYAGWADKFAGELIHTYPRRALDYVKYEPLGVIASFPANNGPMINAVMKLGPALATGNVVILRAPESGPFGIVRLVQLMIEAGLPANVVSVLTGGPSTADALVRHRGIDKISLTGGFATARKVMAAAAENLKPVVLELGGKSANIIFDDADLADAGTVSTFMIVLATNGQGCLYPTRLLVQDGIYEQTVERISRLSHLAVVGDPLNPKTTVGPVSNQAAVDRIMGYIEEARGSARLVVGGTRLGGELAQGYFVQPTVFADVDNKSRLAQNEVFGPVLSITRFKSEDEAIALANDTEYGLHAYVHTTNLKRAHRVADELVAGGVSINAMPVMTPTMPFGGVKSSGFGREGGRAALEEFVHHKNIYVPLD
jgi:aldehyde dehydrogenase (NAD+)